MTDFFKVKDKVVVVTGGTGQLGLTYCKELSKYGAKVVVADIDSNKCKVIANQLTERYGQNTIGIKCDVTKEEDVIKLFSKVEKNYGRVDTIINNAAATGEYLLKEGAAFSDFEDYSLDLWNKVLNVNLTGAFLVCREGGRLMKKQNSGSIINVSSTYGVVGPDHSIYEDMNFRSYVSYSASKAGIHGLTQWLATYWGPNNIRVNTLIPGGVQNDTHSDIFVKRYVQRTPLGRMAKKEDMLGIIFYLVSDSSSYSTGQKFYSDGGWTSK